MVPYLDAMEIFYKNLQKFRSEEPLLYLKWEMNKRVFIKRMNENMPKPTSLIEIDVVYENFRKSLFYVTRKPTDFLDISVAYGQASFKHVFDINFHTSVFICDHYQQLFKITEEEEWLQKIFNISKVYRNVRGELQFEIRLKK